MGDDIPYLSSPETTNEWLDVVIFSRVKDANYSFTHVGDMFLGGLLTKIITLSILYISDMLRKEEEKLILRILT